eukprot:COSAG05_NODE_1361_length_5090_cov_2.050491_3_plen_106_part_00
MTATHSRFHLAQHLRTHLGVHVVVVQAQAHDSAVVIWPIYLPHRHDHMIHRRVVVAHHESVGGTKGRSVFRLLNNSFDGDVALLSGRVLQLIRHKLGVVMQPHEI